MKKRNKKVYSNEVRFNAILRVINDNESVSVVSKDVGCGVTSLRRWIDDYKTYGEAFFGKDGMYCLYKHTTPSGKIYVGQTKQNPLNRWHNGTGYKQNVYFTNAIEKYGWENIKHEIIEFNLSKEEVDKLEKEYIRKLNANDRRFGYNINDGGNGGGGAPLSEAAKKKLSKALKGRPHSKKHNLNVSIAKGRPVKQFTLDGEYITTYHSSCEAARQLGKPSDQQAHIVACCNGERRSAYNYRWCWEDDSEPKKALKYEPVQQRVVSQYHLDGRYIATYKSLKIAGHAIGGDDNTGDNIQMCCAGKTKMAYGYQWKYGNNAENIEALRGHPMYKEVLDYLDEHNKKETAKYFGIPYQTFLRYMERAKDRKLDIAACLY